MPRLPGLPVLAVCQHGNRFTVYRLSVAIKGKCNACAGRRYGERTSDGVGNLFPVINLTHHGITIRQDGYTYRRILPVRLAEHARNGRHGTRTVRILFDGAFRREQVVNDSRVPVRQLRDAELHRLGILFTGKRGVCPYRDGDNPAAGHCRNSGNGNHACFHIFGYTDTLRRFHFYPVQSKPARAIPHADNSRAGQSVQHVAIGVAMYGAHFV